MLIKANGALKPTMSKNVKTDKLIFRTKIKNKTNLKTVKNSSTKT